MAIHVKRLFREERCQDREQEQMFATVAGTYSATATGSGHLKGLVFNGRDPTHCTCYEVGP